MRFFLVFGLGCSGTPDPATDTTNGGAGGDGGAGAGAGGNGGAGGSGGSTGQPCAVLNAPGTAAGFAVSLLADPVDGPLEDRVLRSRLVEFTSAAGTVAVTGGFTLSDENGTTPTELSGDGTLYVRATGPGTGELTVSGACESVTLSLLASADPGLAARSFASEPGFEPVNTFLINEEIHVAVDSTRHADRSGVTAVAHLTPHRAMAEWLADPTIQATASVTTTVGTGTVDTWPFNPADIELDPDAIVNLFDVVIDFDGNGQMDPGDLLDGGDSPGLAIAADLGELGPHTPIVEEWESSYWITQRVYWPEDIDTMGKLPVVVISHGNGHNYWWYDYLGNHLASWGYVVMSHRNDTVPGTITAAVTTVNNTEAFLADPSAVGSGILVDHLDSHNLAFVGHSRGGEGVVIAYDAVYDGVAAPSTFSASDIKVVASIAPVVFEDPVATSNPHEAVYYTIAGSRDGDVTGSVNNGDVMWYRMQANALNDRVVTYVHGADHNDFNCCGAEDNTWGTTGSGEIIGRVPAQSVAKVQLLALFETYLKGTFGVSDFLTRDPTLFRLPTVTPVYASSFVPASWADTYVIDDFQLDNDPLVSSSGGGVSSTVLNLVEGTMQDKDATFTFEELDPFSGFTQSDNDGNPQRGIVFDWLEGTPATLLFDVVAGDVSGWRYVTLRAAQGPRHPTTLELDADLSFGLSLLDAHGKSVTVDTASYALVPTPYKRSNDGNATGWAAEFATIRIPLSAFDGVAGLDLTQVTGVRLDFGSTGTAAGRLGLDDLAFTN